MLSNKIFLIVFSIIAFQVIEGGADIHQIRDEALKTVESISAKLLSLGAETVKEIEKKQNTLANIELAFKKQGKSIANHAITEIQDEVQTSLVKANILNSPPQVISCLFQQGSLGEATTDEKFSGFVNGTTSESEKTKILIANETKKWSETIKEEEKKFRDYYLNCTTQIYLAQNESTIKAILTEFQTKSSALEKTITGILNTISNAFKTYFTALQTQITNLKSALNTNLTESINKIRGCFPKLFNFLFPLELE